MSITRRVFLGAGTAAVAVAAGCGRRSGVEETPTNRVVNLYSARHYDTDNALYESFTQKTGIKVNLVEAEADKLIERLKSEGANSPADVLITVDAGRLWRAQEAGLLLPVTSTVLQTAVPKSLQEEGGHWFGFSRRARIIVYNKERVKPSDLSTYEALADSKWKGRFVVRSSSSVYNQSLTGSLLAALKPQKTEAWAKGLVANFARPPEGNDTAQIKAVATGIGEVTLVNSYYVARLLHSKKADEQAIASKIGVFFPNQGDRGTHVNISGGAVLKTAPNREAAVQFLEHLASPVAQEIFASRSYEYPILEQVAIDPVVKSFGTFKADALNAAVYGRNNAEALQLMDRAGWK
jgi:iron(III) transport system substrate-binding protein